MKIAITVIKAFNIQKYLRIKVPNCIAEITVDDGEPQKTIQARGTDPQWNTTFELEIKESSTIRISILHLESKLSSSRDLRGEVLLCVKNLAMDFGSFMRSLRNVGDIEQKREETTHKLQKAGEGKRGKYGCVVLYIRSLLDPSPSHRSTGPECSGECFNGAVLVPRNPTPPQRLISRPSELPQEDLTSTEMEAAKDAVDGMSIPDSFISVCGYVKAVVHPYARITWNLLTAVGNLERDKKIQEIWSSAADMLDFLKDEKEVIIDALKSTPGLTTIVAAMMKQIYDCASFLREYAGQGFLRRALRDTFDTVTDRTIEEFTSSFRSLKERFQLRSVLTTWKIVRGIQDGTVQFGSPMEAIKDIEQLKLIEDLPGAKLSDVRWDLGNVCLPNTRQHLLNEITSWIDNPEEGSMFWLHGVAGSGKSTIGNTIAMIFANLGRLAASFRFSRDIQRRNVPTYLFGNLAYQLAHFNGQLMNNMLAAIKVYGNMDQWPLRNQMKTFIVDILKDVEFAGPIVIFIDELDESGSENLREPLLQAIVAEAKSMPKFVKFLIVSRDEADIQAKLENICTSRSINYAENVKEDILKFVDHRMAHIRQDYNLPAGWPGDASRYELACRSAGLFIWAAVACKYVEGDDPAVQLDEMLADHTPKSRSTLDNLYLGILQRVCANTPSSVFKYVVGSILLVKTPLTQLALDSLLGLGSHTINHPIVTPDGTKIKCTSSGLIIRRLRSILQNCYYGHHSIRILHPSLFDFLTNGHRCTDLRFLVDTPTQNLHLAFRCFAVMNSLLRRDICSIGDPTKLNHEVSDLDRRLQDNIPEHLRYSCQYWVQHLVDLPDDNFGLYKKAKEFLFLHLLHWLEVMSLLSAVDIAFSMLRSARHWFQHQSVHDPVNHLIEDALHFLEYFNVPIRQSATHIYVSAIPFTPAETILSKTFASRLNFVPRVSSGLCDGLSPCVAVFEEKASYSPVAISPQGSYFALARNDAVVQIWDMTTGTTVGIPFVPPVRHADSEEVMTIDFSRDGTWLITSSNLKVVRLWEVSTGVLVVEFSSPISVHNAQLSIDKTRINIHGVGRMCQSVVLDTSGADVFHHSSRGDAKFQEMSPDGRTIISLYHDGTIQKFDTELGEGVVMEEGTEMEGVDERSAETFPTLSPFSPDGARLVSYTSSKLKIWDTTTATVVVEIPVEEEHFINFSPNGGQFLSGTKGTCFQVGYHTVQLRDSELGTKVGKPFGTSTRTIVFSSDGTRLAYASTGQMILVLDTNSGAVVRCLGHADNKIGAITFSKDGDQVASGGDGGKVKLWNLSSPSSIAVTLQEHLRFVNTLAFSPDGRRVVSSGGSTVRIWDVSINAESSHVLERSSHITSVQPSEAAPRFLSVCDDNTINIWDTTSQNPLVCQFHGHTDRVTSTAFSADGTLVVSGSEDKIVFLWNALTGQVIAPVKESAIPPRVFSFSPSGNQIVSVSDHNMLCIWDVRTGDDLRVPLKEPAHDIKSIAFSQDEKQLIYVLENDVVRFLDVSSGILIRSWCLHQMGQISATFTRDDGHIFSISTDGRCCIWNACTGKVTKHLAADRYLRAREVVYSLDGSQAACVLEEDEIHILDVVTGAPIGPPLKHSCRVRSLLLSADGERVASVSVGGAIWIWDTVAGIIVAEILNAWGGCGFVALSPDGRYLAFSARGGEDFPQNCRIYDTVTETLKPLGGHPDSSSVFLSSLAFSPDGSHVVCTYADHKVIVHDAASASAVGQKMGRWESPTDSNTEVLNVNNSKSALLPYVQSLYGARSAHLRRSKMLWMIGTSAGAAGRCIFSGGTLLTLPTFSTDGLRIACVAAGHEIYVWSVDTGARINGPLRDPEDNEIISLALPGNGQRVVSLCKSSCVHIWDVDSGVHQDNPLDCQTDYRHVHLSPDGTHVVVNNNHMELWDAALCTKILDFQDHCNSNGESVVFSPDGSRLLSINYYDAVSLWDVMRGTLINVLLTGNHWSCGLHHVRARFSPDGTKVASWMNGKPGFRLWDGKTGAYMQRFLSSTTRDVMSLSFATTSTQILCEPMDNHKCAMEIWDIGDLPHRVTSTSNYPTQRMMVRHVHACKKNDGWFRGENGARLFWVPPSERGVWFSSRPGRVILGRDQHKVVVVDIEDYLKLPQVRHSWREKGVRYTLNEQDVVLASVLTGLLE